MNLQLFGGRGMASKSGGAGTSKNGELTEAETTALLKEIDKKAFTNVGNGQWEINFDSAPDIGAMILDESDTKAGGYGRMKAYSVKTWGQNVGDVEESMWSSLSAAKNAARQSLKGWVPGYRKHGK